MSERITLDGVEYVRAYPVAPDRCPCCGHTAPGWRAPDIIEALQVWAYAHGRPPRAYEWANATPNHPADSTVLRVFGTWNGALAAAGLDPRRSGAPQEWTFQAIVEAMREWKRVNGRWPVCRDWKQSAPEHPVMSTVMRVCGSWNTARRAAGYRGHDKAHARTLLKGRADEFVDAAPLKTVLAALEGERLAAVANEAGVTTDYLYRVKKGSIRRVRFSNADRIVVALDRPDLLAA